MYKSPIEIIYGQMQTQMEVDVLRTVQNYGINVDKEELIKALEYDRNQYDKGYTQGYRVGRKEAMDTIVHCKDCVHWERSNLTKAIHSIRLEYGYCRECMTIVGSEHFCSYGERKGEV